MKNRQEIFFTLGSKLLWLVILGFGRIGRIRVRGRNHFRNALRSGRPVLIVVWHGKMVLPIYVHRSQGISAMVSEHRDGELIARTVHRLGYATVRGSSTRGGSRAFRQMLRQLKSGRICAVLPDGPNGPRHVFKLGAVVLAQRAGALLLPMTFAAARPIILRTWDRMTFWRPFSRLVAQYGEPLQVPRHISPEELEICRQEIEKRLRVLQDKADDHFRT